MTYDWEQQKELTTRLSIIENYTLKALHYELQPSWVPCRVLLYIKFLPSFGITYSTSYSFIG